MKGNTRITQQWCAFA